MQIEKDIKSDETPDTFQLLYKEIIELENYFWIR